MLIANQLCVRKASRLGDFKARLQRIRGGRIDTELKELTVRPIGRPSSPTEVTITTPVVNDPSTLRSLRGSKVCRDGAGFITTSLSCVPLRASQPRQPGRSELFACLGSPSQQGEPWSAGRARDRASP